LIKEIVGDANGQSIVIERMSMLSSQNLIGIASPIAPISIFDIFQSHVNLAENFQKTIQIVILV
jgi:hypothetical protein